MPVVDRVDLKASLPIPFGGRVYMRFVVGRERRNLHRLQQEGQTASTRISFVYAVVLYLIAANAAFGAICAGYLLKSLIGINVLAGHSPLHPLYVTLVEGAK